MAGAGLMAAKKSAVDRVLAELQAERDGIDRTMSRLRNAQAAVASKKKSSRVKDVPATAGDRVGEGR
jgi:hypothetical protein